MKTIFFNNFHNGDIHVSREYVRQIMKKVKQLDPSSTFAYAHKNGDNLLADIRDLAYEPGSAAWATNGYATLFKNSEGSLFMNTWYAQQHNRYMNRYGITMDTLYAAFDDACKTTWNFSLSDISPDPRKFFPVIDYTAFQVQKAQQWLASHPEKKIFISNGQVLSGQAHNFPLIHSAVSVAQRHPDKAFILSNREGPLSLPNMFYSSDIIGKAGFDLNENAFITEHCDVIVGKASGAFTFAMNQSNFFHRTPKFICFTNLIPTSPEQFWLSDLLSGRVKYTAQFVIADEANHERAANIINDNL